MKFLRALPLFLIACVASAAVQPATWQARLQQELPLMGHRNWILIADSAYPWQTSAGVETMETGVDQIAVVKEVLGDLAASKHVRPIVYMDAELPYLTESDAPGVARYRKEIRMALGKNAIQSMPHEQWIETLNQAGGTFHVLVLKTTLTVPYTSVFLRLDCKYWSDAAENELRAKMKADKSKP